MNAKPYHLRCLNAWPILAILVIYLTAGMNYDDHVFATFLFITSAIWALPVILTHWIFDITGTTAPDWIVYLTTVSTFMLFIECMVHVLQIRRPTPP